ncbi:serine/threonine-protein kinase [Rhodococcus sp. X156]|uniref:serine/threonine-protein kinase n=1 Tax=Rhodococcus sp. X156 TaxID=2499145 RepID=UPI000FD7DC66|nr:serine/threonine-protein kinase [Rhodococcus sp. X156]
MSLSAGAVLADRYRLSGLIAVGGMGEVWEAIDTRLNRRVAVKVLKPEFSSDSEFVDRFRVEARTAAALNHPGIAGVYDYGETATLDDGQRHTAYLVMELVDGEPLSAVLAREGALDLEQALDMLEQTARALAAAHNRGIVHRDVKPGNILITPTGQVKITDFGIAKATDAAPVTRTGMVVGTAQYIAPEQALGKEATPASDIYALGVVGHEAVSGSRPFTGDNPLSVAMMHVRDQPPALPPHVPATIRVLLESAMAKDPQQRYATGGQFADAIAAVRAGRSPARPAEAATPPLPAPPPRTQRMAASPVPPAAPTGATQATDYSPVAQQQRASANKGLLAILAVLVVALLGVGGWALLSSAGGDDDGPPSVPVPTTTQAPAPSATTQVPTTTRAPSTTRATTTTEAPSTTEEPTTTTPPPAPTTTTAAPPTTSQRTTTATVPPTTTSAPAPTVPSATGGRGTTGGTAPTSNGSTGSAGATGTPTPTATSGGAPGATTG